MLPADTPTPPGTVVLSDGSVWRLRRDAWEYFDDGGTSEPAQWVTDDIGKYAETASDHRLIADTLDPPRGTCATCGENIYHDDN